jgi:four helix bundle protein
MKNAELRMKSGFVFEKEIGYGNPIVTKSLAFGIRIVKFYKILFTRFKEYDAIFRQLIRCGTSVGANVSEAQSAISKKDFVNKMQIALKESRETEYWLKLLIGTEIINSKEYQSLFADCEELSKLLTSILKSSKHNIENS